MMKLRFVSSALALSALLVLGCESGGGSGGPAVPTGSVNVLLTDGPTDDYTAINLTVAQIDLLGRKKRKKDDDDDDRDDDDDEKSGRYTLFSGTATFDLLKLENYSTLFSISPDVPAGTYKKIRLHVTEIELVERDTGASVFPRLPGNGKLDLRSRDALLVEPNSALVLQIDIDAKKSVHIKTKSDGTVRFRPVVFVTAGTAPPTPPPPQDESKLVRVQGFINRIDQANNSFNLQLGGLGGELITVVLAADGAIFDAGGEPIALDFRLLDNLGSALGQFSATDPTVFEALVVQLGTFNDFVYATLSGSVNSAPDAGGRFQLSLDQGQASSTDPVVDVLLRPQTRVLDSTGNVLDTTALVPGARVDVDAVVDTATDPDTLIAASVVLPVTTTVAQTQISGQVASVAPGGVTLATERGDRCVRIAASAGISLTRESSESVAIGPADLADITAGDDLDAYGNEDDDGCFAAQAASVFRDD